MTTDFTDRYHRDGFASPLRVIDADTAAEHRARLEWAEERLGPLHYQDQMHTILTSAWELANEPTLLDAVEEIVGPDILLYNSTYVIKEAQTPAKVNWHQDLTYWGLSHDDAQVTAWIALSPATETSGCMQMLPGSHLSGRIEHRTPDHRRDDDVLDLGQYIDDIDQSMAVVQPLEPGEASFHHGWTVHASMPNRSDDRRIGLNMQFLAPHCRQLVHNDDTAILLRGEDRYGHFRAGRPAAADLEPEAVDRQRRARELIKGTYETVRNT